MADGDYETANSIDNRVSAAVNAATRQLRSEIQTLKKQMEEATSRMLVAERLAAETLQMTEALAAEMTLLRKLRGD